MDIFAHFLWTFAMYWKHPKRWIAGVIGFLPDILAFGPHTVASVFTGGFGRPALHTIPQYVFTMYSITHSLVICAIGMILLWFFARNWFWLSFGWPLHILIDIPTHTDAFFATPVLWPLSDSHLSGVSWGAGWFMLANYGALIAVYTYLIWKVPGPQNFKV